MIAFGLVGDAIHRNDLNKHANAIHKLKRCAGRQRQSSAGCYVQIIGDCVFASWQIAVLIDGTANHKGLTGLAEATEELLQQCEHWRSLITNCRIWVDLCWIYCSCYLPKWAILQCWLASSG